MRVKLTVVVNFVLVAGCLLAAGLLSDASAQTITRGQSRPATTRPTPQRQAAPRETEADASADLSITAHVTADSLRFEKVPNPRVEFTGRQKRETAWESERENLPQEVRPGETYRNIGITLHIRSVFADIDRIVAEALGEVPTSDDARPAPAQPQPPGTSTPPAESTTPPAQAHVNDAAATRPRRGLTGRGRGN
ncbi:MAG: hypothetical protein QOH49_3615 [Acidobacteriota bacterium]|jgi:hypothetical protein|nr:hypothetical protein [Acidobacteriota bacterium]MDT5271429.1 hypothetical protein [Acidobacteriota bacterium]